MKSKWNPPPMQSHSNVCVAYPNDDKNQGSGMWLWTNLKMCVGVGLGGAVLNCVYAAYFFLNRHMPIQNFFCLLCQNLL